MDKIRKKIYFLSDAHLGSWALEHRRTHERRLVNFLDEIKHEAAAVYLLGDIFDYWYEYKYVVPKGYTRLLGKISELTDRGIEVHFFTGNHDIWCKDYFVEECGMVMHREPITIDLYGKVHSHTLQTLFSAIHPRWTVKLGLTWAKHSRLKREGGKEPDYMGEEREPLIRYTKEYLKTHPDINYFIYGHRHIMLDMMLTRQARIIIVGDWIKYFSYAVFDGNELVIDQYVEGDKERPVR